MMIFHTELDERGEEIRVWSFFDEREDVDDVDDTVCEHCDNDMMGILCTCDHDFPDCPES